MKSQQLSIIIISGNAQSTIIDCLKSCSFASEIIVILANSTDKTENLIKQHDPTIKLISTTDGYNRNFAKWRNLGYEKSHCPWILYVDTDEIVTPELKSEILSTIADDHINFSHYAIPRKNYFLNHRVKFGGTYPDYVKRLFKKTLFQGFTGILHEEPIIAGEIGYLKAPFLHYTHTNLDSMLHKSLIWTDMEANALYQSHHPPIVWWRFLRMMLTKIWQRLIVQQMWRDGTVGWISVIFETFDTFMIYARLWELQQTHSKNSPVS